MKRFGVFLALSLTAGCPADDDGDDGAAGSSSGGADTAMMTAADDGVDDGVDDGGSTSNGGTMGPSDSSGDPPADSTGDPMGSSTGGDTMGDPTGDSTGGAMGATVSGTVFRDAATPPGIGQDAIGDVYLGLLIACDQGAASVASTVIMGADLSNPKVGADYTIEGAPDGTYFLAGFMDDNGNADPDDPDADMGDLAAAMGLGPACTQVNVVNGVDVTGADITLNLVVPF
ncbi:MAG: hypothetical protein AAF721_00750 [Myxococcota bacterium]